LRGVQNMMATNMRFIERDYYKKLMLANSELMSESHVDKILDTASYTWIDLTFKFYENGSMLIIDNHSDLPFPISDLRGAAYDFYVRQRIHMIRTSLEAKILQTA
jgi:hypothetical protein